MMKIEEKINLSPVRRKLLEKIEANLENTNSLWIPGWKKITPVSYLTGKPYSGVNNITLTLAQNEKKYDDPRWLTYKQILKGGFSFKRDEKGKTVATGAGIPIEFYELYDKKEKKAFQESSLAYLSDKEKAKYVKDNVRITRHTYIVFNASLLEGISKWKEEPNLKEECSYRAEYLLDFWNENEAKIHFDGDNAYYDVASDTIHLPRENYFLSKEEKYSTAFHEMAHSTGAKRRLNRDLTGLFGTEEYASEELRAEIASMFLEQDLGLEVSDGHQKNNATYIRLWLKSIKSNPKMFFDAILDAEKISEYILSKEKDQKKISYAILEEQDSTLQPHYRMVIATKDGEMKQGIPGTFKSIYLLKEELEKLIQKDKKHSFFEVSPDKLSAICDIRSLSNKRKESHVFKKPSDLYEENKTRDFSPKRGPDNLKRISDRDVYERASMSPFGDSFVKLFSGVPIMEGDANNAYGLLTRLAMYTGGNSEQMLRIFRESGLYKKDKEPLYAALTSTAVNFVRGLKEQESSKEKEDENKKQSGKEMDSYSGK